MNVTPLRYGEGNTSPRRVTAKLRASEAVQMRLAGHSYRALARRLDYSGPGAAYKAVTRELNAVRQEPAEELRKLEVARLDRALRALWPKVLKGQTRAVDSFLRLSKRRADLLGLDAPTRIRVEDVRAEAQQLRDQLVEAGLAGEHTDVAEIIAMAERIALGDL